MNVARKCWRLSCMLMVAAAVLTGSSLWGQTANGRISGTVKDQTGGAIVGASVVVTDVARGLSRNLTTDQVGAYLAPNLIPGQYTVRASFMGFQNWERTNITLQVAQDLFIDVVLQPGAQTQTVTITEEVPLVNTTSATLGGTLNSQTIEDLPIAGRNYINLLELRPGTVMQLGNNSNGGGAASTNGLRAESSNSYAIEGVTGIDPYTGQSVVNNIGVNGDAASLLSVDAIQEFNQQFNSKAEAGYKAGSNVAVGLKSGTNTLHGTAYGYFRDGATDALNYYNPYDTVGGKTTPIDINVSQQQFGGTVGGPIKKDKLFFFLAYEQERFHVGNPRALNGFFTDPGMLANYPACLAVVNSCTPKPGLFPNILGGTVGPDASNHVVLACNALAPAARSPQSLALLGMAPDCSLPGGTSVANGSYAAGHVNPDFFVDHGANDHGAQGSLNPAITTFYPNNQTSVQAIGSLAKIDYTINDRHSINGFAFIGTGERYDGLGTQPSERYLTNFIQHPRMVAGTWTWIPSATVANSFRFGYASLDQPNYGVDVEQGFTAAQLGLNTGVTRAGQVGVPEQISLAGYYVLGSRETDLQGPGRSIEFTDTISYLRGDHALKFGGTIVRDIQNVSINARGKGRFTFGRTGGGVNPSGLVGFLVGQGAIPGTIGTGITASSIRSSNTGLDSASLLYGDPYSKALRTNYSAFFQDDWRVNSRLTLNLGVRYDVSSPLTTANHSLGTVNLDLPGGIAQEGINTDRIYKRDGNNVAPRVGFAWDVGGNGKTVIRGGGSIVFDLITLRTYLEVGNDLGLAGPPSGFITGCTINDSVLASTITSPSALSNCEEAGGNLTTPGGTRKIGIISWSRSAGNIQGPVLWDRPSASDTIFPDSNSARLNCDPNILTRDRIGGAARAGVACTDIPSINPNLKTPYVETWTLSVQRALTNNVLLDVAYVGNHGVNLLGKTNPNQPATGAGWTSPAGKALVATCLAQQRSAVCNTDPDPAVQTTLRPLYAQFPWMGDIVNINGGETSNYNGLQTTLTMRNFHGLSMVSGYTWSHALSISENNNGGLGTDTYNPSLDYGQSGSDLRHRFTMSPTYALPSVAGYGGLLDGWKLNATYRYQVGRPLSMTSTIDFGGTGNGAATRWDLYGSASDFKADYASSVGNVRNPNLAQFYPGCAASKLVDTSANCSGAGELPSGINPRTGKAYVTADLAVNNPICQAAAGSSLAKQAMVRAIGCWVQGNSALTAPALGTYGNTTKGQFTGLPFWDLDFSISKRQKISERYSAEFKLETFNILNHPAFNQPTATGGSTLTTCTTATCAFQTIGSTPDVAASNPVIGSGGPRRLSFGVKLIF